MIVSHQFRPPPHVRPALVRVLECRRSMLLDVRPYGVGYAQTATDLFRQSSLFPLARGWVLGPDKQEGKGISAKERGLSSGIQALELRDTLQDTKEA